MSRSGREYRGRGRRTIPGTVRMHCRKCGRVVVLSRAVVAVATESGHNLPCHLCGARMTYHTRG